MKYAKRSIPVALSAACLAVTLAYAQPAADAQVGQLWSVQVHYDNPADLAKLGPLTDHARVDAQQHVVYAEVGDFELQKFRQTGLRVEVDEAETKRIRAFVADRKAALSKSGGALKSKSGDTAPSTDTGGTLTPQSISDGQHSCYRTVEQTFAYIEALAKKYPNLAEVKTVGNTWIQNQALSFRNLVAHTMPASILKLIDLDLLPDADAANPLKVLIIGNKSKASADRPKFVATASIHAREYTPAELTTRFGEWLLNNYGKDPEATWLVDHNEFHLIVHANPDGRKLAEQAVPVLYGGGWRKNVDVKEGTGYCKTRPQDSGVDLNRNFPFGWAKTNGQGSDTQPCGDGPNDQAGGQTYHGASAGSEPETQAIVKYIAGTLKGGKYTGGVLPDLRPDDFDSVAPSSYPGLYLDIHSYSQLVLWPWGYKWPENGNSSFTQNHKQMTTLGQRLAWFSKYAPVQQINYDVDGTTTDTFYGYLGAPSYTLELGTSFYESCGSFEKTTFPKNFDTLRYAARVLHAPYELPAGPEAFKTALTKAVVLAGDKTKVSATIDDTRYYNENRYNRQPPIPDEQPFPIKAANAYIDKLPWEAGAKPIKLKPAVGAFDSATTKDVVGTIDTTDLAPGRHLIYVQGINSQDKPGPVGAVFLDVAGVPGTGDNGKISPQGGDTGGGGGAFGWMEGALLFLGGLFGLTALRRRRS